MFEFYLDTANADVVRRIAKSLPIYGVTTNPTILAKYQQGIYHVLPALTDVLGESARFHVQVVSQTADKMLEEAKQLNALPHNIVVKVPATAVGLEAIKKIKKLDIPVLATAIYSEQQGFLAALCGADYLAPYVNRIDALGADGVRVVGDLQNLIEKHQFACTLLPASFKSTQQVMAVLALGVGAITLPVNVVEQMLNHPAVQPAVDDFYKDWQYEFGEKLAFET